MIKLLSNILPSKLKKKTEDLYRIGYIANTDSPTTFNEKIRARMANPDSLELLSLCSDKLKVRDYVKRKVGDEYLIPIIQVFDGFVKKSDIKFPSVLKANHNSGPVYIIRKKEDINDHMINDINKQITIDYGKAHGELWYSNITPRIFLESLLLDNNKVPDDYKFHIFNDGVTSRIIIQVDFDRFENHKRAFYDENLELLPFGILYPSSGYQINKPKNLDKMIELASTLAVDFNYVRVDLYNLDGLIYFGELTFAHGAGRERFYPKHYDKLLGSYWGK